MCVAAHRCECWPADRVDAMASLAVLDAALQSRWQAAPVWLHGDVAAGNLLTVDGVLAAVIDFGCSAVGDPACDLVVAWTLLSAPGRAAFRSAIELDEQTWARARGWALWKAAITLAQYDTAAKPRAAEAAEVLALVLAEHAHSHAHSKGAVADAKQEARRANRAAPPLRDSSRGKSARTATGRCRGPGAKGA